MRSKSLRVSVTYKGGHNFDYDARLEAFAGKTRNGSGYNFETETRDIGFEFDTDDQGKLFSARVRSAFPDFGVHTRTE